MSSDFNTHIKLSFSEDFFFFFFSHAAQFVVIVMIMSTVGLLSSMLVSYISNRDPSVRPPLWLRRLCFKYLATLMCHVAAKSKGIQQGISSSSKSDGIENISFQNDTGRNRARHFDNSDREFGLYKTEFNNGVYYITSLPSRKHHEKVDHVNSGAKGSSKLNGCYKEVREILANISKMNKHIEETNHADRVRTEWKHIGRIVDRTLFWITFLLLIAMTLLVFLTTML